MSTALPYTNNLETKKSYKRKVNLKNITFFKKKIYRAVEKNIRWFVEVDQNVYKQITRAPRYILIQSFFLAIGWSYLHDLSQTFFKKIETTMRWNLKLHVKSASFSTDNSWTSRLSIFYCISNHKNFIPKYLDNALRDFA